MVVSWAGAAGAFYRIETSRNLAEWTLIPGDYAGSGAMISATMRAVGPYFAPKAFWRVVISDSAFLSVSYPMLTTPTVGQSFVLAPSVVNPTPGQSIIYALSRGALPAGLTLNPSSGVISGTPTQLGAFTVEIKAVSGTKWTVAGYSGAVNLSTGVANVMATPSIDEFRIVAPTAQYYVDSKSGNDLADGKTSLTPWKSFSKIHALTLASGNVVNLARGSKWAGPLVLKNSGTPGNPIVVQAYGTGEAPTIERFTAESDLSNGVVISGSYVHLLDVRVVGLHWSAIHLEKWTQHVVIAGTEILNCGSGVDLIGKHHRAIANNVHDMTIVVDTGNAATAWGANAFGFRGEDIEIAWNRMVNCRDRCKNFGGWDGGAIEFYGYDTGGLGWNNSTKDIRIHHNYAENCDGFLEANGRLSGLVIAHNVFIEIPSNVFVFHMLVNEGIRNIYGARIENNTVTGGNTVFSFWNPKPEEPAPGSSFIVRNNIAAFRSHLAWDTRCVGSDVVHDHNLFYFLPGTPAAPGVDPTPGGNLGEDQPIHTWTLGDGEFTTSRNPGFVDAEAGDVRLVPDSIAVDAGSATCTSGYSSDPLGTPVPVGNAMDLGAYEWR